MAGCLKLHLRIIPPLIRSPPSSTATGFRRYTMPATSTVRCNGNGISIHPSVDETYENAVRTLNSLQSNSQTIAKVRENRETKRSSSIPQTIGAMETCGLSLDMIDKLSIIHVAGTKGKGMTCAFTESILRHAGLKTGFFSSPHLTAVRERIRINGKPLSTEAFAKCFFYLYNRLKHLKEPNAPYEMPHYFRFLTCMAFQTFINEKVDVAIMEVGIGGTYDTTNVIRKPVVVGISTLSLEHQAILGNSLEEIAIQKAGIMKPGVPAYTVSTHPPHIMELLRAHAATVSCPIYTVPDLDINEVPTRLGVDKDGFVSRTNATLAVHLANELLLRKWPERFPSLPNKIPCAANLVNSSPKHYLPFHITGLQSTKWDGRYQILKVSDKLQYCIDGAHTLDSLAITLKWYAKVAAPSSVKILVFNLQGGRPHREFLEIIAKSSVIDIAIFCPFIVSTTRKTTPDNWSALASDKDAIEDCRLLARTWETLQSKSKGIVCDSAESTVGYIQDLVKRNKNVTSFGMSLDQNDSTSVLITGSLHLVGTFLSVLDPHRNDE